uniref:Uncharacterized protein n=1 Tax=Lotus japonicus TaxID=34305 RepID=I3SPS4_LOTJA|nr:unknown [Lotus japonicus]
MLVLKKEIHNGRANQLVGLHQVRIIAAINAANPSDIHFAYTLIIAAPEFSAVVLTCDESSEDDAVSLSGLGAFAASAEGSGAKDGAFAGALATAKKSVGRSTLPTL